MFVTDANGATDNQQNGSEEGKGYETRGYGGQSDDSVQYILITCKQSLVQSPLTV